MPAITHRSRLTHPLLAAALLCASSEAIAHQPAPPADTRIDRVLAGLRPATEFTGETPTRWTLAARMAHHSVPGVSIAIIDDGRIVWAKGFGIKEVGSTDPVDETTLFQAASISKPIAAIGIMKLVKEGKLDLDTDVNTYLTSWKLPDSEFTATQKVTLRHLLSHSAGLTVHGFAGYPIGSPVPTIPQVLDGVSPSLSPPVRSERAPGEGFKYSGGGTTIAQLLVADLTGQDSAAFLNETVLAPLGMTHSTFQQPLPESFAGRASSAHYGSPAEVIEGKSHFYPMVFAAGLWTTPTDLCRMGLAVQRAAKGDASGPLDPEIVKQMLTMTAAPVGLGFFLDGEGERQRFEHGGGNDGFLSTFEACTHLGKGLAVMINGDAGGEILGEIARAIRAEYSWPQDGIKRITPIQLSPDQLSKFVGTYRLKADPKITIVLSQMHGGLELRVEGAPRPQSAELLATTATTLVPRDGDLDVRVEGEGAKPYDTIWLVSGRFQADRVK